MGEWTKGLLKARGRFVDATGSVDTYDGPVSSSIIVCEETSATDGDGRVWTTSGRPEANAERLVACWNAMLGITDPAATMKEVVEVLEFAGTYIGMQAGSDPDAFPYLERVRAMLAKLGRGS